MFLLFIITFNSLCYRTMLRCKMQFLNLFYKPILKIYELAFPRWKTTCCVFHHWCLLGCMQNTEMDPMWLTGSCGPAVHAMFVEGGVMFCWAALDDLLCVGSLAFLLNVLLLVWCLQSVFDSSMIQAVLKPHPPAASVFIFYVIMPKRDHTRSDLSHFRLFTISWL